MMKRLILLLATLPAFAAGRATLVTSGEIPPPARYGIEALRQGLASKGESDLIVLAGLRSSPAVAAALGAAKAALPSGPQALVIQHGKYHGKPALILCGSDAVGLMYAALDTAARPLDEVRDVSEHPYLAERGVSMYTMQRAYFESRLYDQNYWKRYFDLLARSRINQFTVIFGYENGGFMAPAYPYFYNTAGFDGVRLSGITHQQQEKNTAAFHTLMRIAHERGIAVTAGIWDHIYRGGVQGGGIPGADDAVGKAAPGLVTGLDADNLAPYTKSALRRFVEVFPEIDGLEFRMHYESGLKRTEMAGFWHEVFGILAHLKPGLQLTMRAKDLPDSIIADAIAQGLHSRIETKYWMEQMGLPFHPTHVNKQDQQNRRHGYADLLRYPQDYRVHWRLWTGGTARLLLWGDPEYVRRFVASARLYDGQSMEVNEMLATKMLGSPHDQAPRPILNDRYKYYDYEFERYWHFYQLWGRIAYNPQTPAELWEKEFQRRFGAAGPSLMRGLHLASQVLPRIVASSYRYEMFPTTRGWAEMMRQDDLTKFAALDGSDIEQFMSPRAEAASILSGSDTSLRRPEETSRWFAATSKSILKQVAAARAADVTGDEARSTIADLEILAWLAKYYSERILAAVAYNLHRMDTAIEREHNAVAAWEQIVKSAGDVYRDDLAFGVHPVGFPHHWKEELVKLQAGVAKLEAEHRDAGSVEWRPENHAPNVQLEPVGKAHTGADLRIVARADAATMKSMRLRYRHLTQYEDYQTADMDYDATSGLYAANIPGDFIIAKWDLIYFIEAIDKQGNGRNFPDLDTGDPYVIVPVERAVLKK